MEQSTYRGITLRELPSDLRPRVRLISAGAQVLSNADLIATLIGSGRPGENAVRLAERMLVDHGGLAGLAYLSVDELCSIPGIGPSKAATIKAAIELSIRIACLPPYSGTLTLRTPSDTAHLLMPEMSLLEQEELRILLLDTKNHLKRVVTLYKGSLNTAIVRIGEVFRDAIRTNSDGIILAHNHPSGDPLPSPEDVRCTQEIYNAGKFLDILVLDHIIIGRNCFYSLKERGLGFSDQ